MMDYNTGPASKALFRHEVESWTHNDKFLTWATPTYEWFQERTFKALEAYVAKHRGFALFGLCGNAGTGKDSATIYLRNAKPDRVCTMAFADPIRSIGQIFGFTMEQMTDRQQKESVDKFWGITPRKFMQLVGTEMFRNQWREDVWVELLKHRIINTFGKDIIFVTDVRFPNEADAIHELGGRIVKITRDGFTKKGANLHDSERLLDSIKGDINIVNNAKDEFDWTMKFTTDLVKNINSDAYFY